MELQTNVKSGEVKITEAGETKPVQETTEKKPEADLITRVSQFKKEEVKEPTGEIKEPEFDFKEIDTIEDPKAKEYAEKAYKSFQKGFNQKFQELADLRKGYEQRLTESSNWTPEKIQQLLNDQNFVTAAQGVMRSQAPQNFEGTQEEWSALSETDRAKFQNLEREILSLKQQNMQTLKMQQDETLKNKYTNYDPKAVDIITSDFLAGKVQATREDIWKIHDYPNAIERAYNMGLLDGKTGIREKVSSSSMEGTVAVSNKEALKKEEGETDRNYFKRIFLNNIAKQKETNFKK